MASTKRPQNRCGACGYTWFPRGKNLSPQCPKCGSGKTKVVGVGVLGVIGFVAVLIALGSNDKPKAPATETPNAAVLQEPIPSAPDLMPVAATDAPDRVQKPAGVAAPATEIPSQRPATAAVATGLSALPEQPPQAGQEQTEPAVQAPRDPFTSGG